jgi:RHS repeat-associated protein
MYFSRNDSSDAPGTQLPATMTGTPASGTTTDIFTYNPRGEVINSVNSQIQSSNRTYTYDPIGNRLNTTEGDLNNASTNPSAQTYTSNPLNQYTQISTTLPLPPSTTQPTYDDDGNILTVGTGKTYTWDSENRLTQVTLPNSEIVQYAYDATSRRIQRQHITSTNTQTTTYHYDAWNVIHEKTTHSNTIPESVTTPTETTHHWGLDLSNTLQGAGGVSGLLHSKTTTGETPTHHHYTYDANGNVSDLLIPTGTTHAHYEYDPFGNTLTTTGPIAQENPYRFSTKPYDPIIDLHYYGYRFYSPQLARWLNRDPINEKGGLNLNAVNRNNLISYVDIRGLFIELWYGTHGVTAGFKHSKLWLITDEKDFVDSLNGKYDFNRAKSKTEPKKNLTEETSCLWFLSIGAGPDSTFDGWPWDWALMDMKAEFNRKNDIGEPLETPVLITSFGQADAKFFLDDTRCSMEIMNHNFINTTLEYYFFPGANNNSFFSWDDFNSNSFVSGFLKATKYNVPTVSVSVPGYRKPVPSFIFQIPFSNTRMLKKAWKLILGEAPWEIF